MENTPPSTPRAGVLEGEVAPATPKKTWDGGGGCSGVKPLLSESPVLPQKRAGARRKHQQSVASMQSTGSKKSLPWMGPVCMRSLNDTGNTGTPEGSPFHLLPPFTSSDMLPSPSPSPSPPVPHISGWFSAQFKPVGQIGQGNFGHVVQAQNLLDGVVYAVKKLDTAIRSKRDLSRRIDEAKVLARCNHPNIVRYFSCWVEDRHLYLQTEFCSGGSLLSCIERRKSENSSGLDETGVTSLLLQMTLALTHLHDEVKVAHLDIKPENIYIHEDLYKLGDFGHAHFLEEDQRERVGQSFDSIVSFENESRFSLEEGDIRYLPLEMLNDKTHLKEADIFSLGLSVYEACTGVQPPHGAEAPWRKLRERGLDQGLLAANGYSPHLSLVLESMTAKEPTERPSAADILVKHRNLFIPSSSVSTSVEFFKQQNGLFSAVLRSRAMQIPDVALAGMAKAP